MDAKKCDICGTLYVRENKAGEGTVTISINRECDAYYDLCPGCMERMAKFMQRKLIDTAECERVIEEQRREISELKAKFEKAARMAICPASMKDMQENERLRRQIKAMDEENAMLRQDITMLAQGCIKCAKCRYFSVGNKDMPCKACKGGSEFEYRKPEAYRTAIGGSER